MRIALIVLLLCFAAGCGGGSEGSGIFSTGIDKKAAILTLTDSQVSQACSKARDFFSKYFFDARSCYVDGLAETRLITPRNQAQTQCESIVNMCTSDPSENNSLRSLNVCELQEIERSGCTATIEQYESCIIEKSEKLEAFLDILSCEEAGNEDYYNITVENFFGNTILSGPHCQKFLSTCSL